MIADDDMGTEIPPDKNTLSGVSSYPQLVFDIDPTKSTILIALAVLTFSLVALAKCLKRRERRVAADVPIVASGVPLVGSVPAQPKAIVPETVRPTTELDVSNGQCQPTLQKKRTTRSTAVPGPTNVVSLGGKDGKMKSPGRSSLPLMMTPAQLNLCDQLFEKWGGTVKDLSMESKELIESGLTPSMVSLQFCHINQLRDGGGEEMEDASIQTKTTRTKERGAMGGMKTRSKSMGSATNPQQQVKDQNTGVSTRSRQLETLEKGIERSIEKKKKEMEAMITATPSSVGAGPRAPDMKFTSKARSPVAENSPPPSPEEITHRRTRRIPTTALRTPQTSSPQRARTRSRKMEPEERYSVSDVKATVSTEVLQGTPAPPKSTVRKRGRSSAVELARHQAQQEAETVASTRAASLRSSRVGAGKRRKV